MELLNGLDPELQMLINNEEDGYTWRKPRQDDWLENYTLYRDKVTYNRLTQRQSVNLPVMKYSIRTLLKDIDDLPVLYYENLDNDKQAEAFKNEYWGWTVKENNMVLKDIIDKKQVLMFGRTFDQWQVANGKVIQTIQDPQDILVSRYADPADINTSRFLSHCHIYKPLSEIENNPIYDQEEVYKLKQFFATDMGLIKEQHNREMATEKNRKMQEMGKEDVESPILGETYVEMSMQFVWRDKESRKGKVFEDQIFLYVKAENQAILLKAPLEEVIGTTKDHFWQKNYNYVTWADDPERQDFWSDAVADIIRTSNKVLNTWFSQLVENRTLRNFGMNYYDSTNPDFVPGTFNPEPWGWYGMPGDPNKLVKRVDIPELSESLDEMQFVITMMEKATGATATQQGAKVDKQVTLGEVQLALGEAKERVKGMSKFYTPAWERKGLMFIKLLEAAGADLDAVKVYKKGRNTDKIYSREISQKDWKTATGYRCKVWSQDEKRTQDVANLQKLSAATAIMPMNKKLREIQKRKTLEFCDLTPEDINAVMDEEKENSQFNNLVPGQMQPVQPQLAPVNNNVVRQVA